MGPRGARRGMVSFPFCDITLRGQLPDPIGYPREPASVGEHLKQRRFDQGLTQAALAEHLGTCAGSVRNWEKGKTSPALKQWQAVIAFLGFDPNPEPKNLAELLLAIRRQHGWSLREFAGVLDVAPETIGGWEQKAHRPTGPAKRKLLAFLEEAEIEMVGI